MKKYLKKRIPWILTIKILIPYFLALLLFLLVYFCWGKINIVLNGEESLNVPFKSEYKDLGANVTYNRQINNLDITSKLLVYNDVDTTKLGTYEVNYKVYYRFKRLSMKRLVHVIDVTSPVIILNGDKEIYCAKGTKYVEKGAQAIDDVDGDISDKIIMEGEVNTSKTGTYILKYTATDSSGNVSIVERKIVIYTYDPTYKVIYLTFDDGPSQYTSKLLDILKKYNVKATFFVTMSGSNSVIKREYQEGHTVAIHTASHEYSIIYASTTNYFNDLNRVSNRIERITGVKPMILRFPGGSSNTISRKYCRGIMTTLTAEVKARGYKYFDWTITSGDAGGTTKTSKVYTNVVNSLSSSKANIVLQHDIKGFSVDAVEDIIKYGLEHGYTFLPITSTTKEVHFKVNN